MSQVTGSKDKDLNTLTSTQSGEGECMNWLWIYSVVVASAFCYFLGRYQEAALCKAEMVRHEKKRGRQ